MSEMELLQCQVGKETTWGTAVACTAKRMGVEKFEFAPEVNSKMLKEKRASLAPGFQSVLTDIEGAADDEGDVTYEDICYILDGLIAEATPGGAGPYTRDYTGPLGTKPTPRNQTVMWGDASGTYRLAGAIPAELTLTGETGKGTMRYKSKWIGKIIDGGTLAALTDRVVTPVTMDQTLLYVDALAGTMGATLLDLSHLKFEIKIANSRKLQRYIGALTPGSVKHHAFDVTAKFTLEFNAAVKAYLDEIVAAAPTATMGRQIRLKAAISTTHLLQVDISGVSLKAPKVFTDEDDVATVELELTGQYNSGAFANYLKVNTKNAVAALA